MTRFKYRVDLFKEKHVTDIGGTKIASRETDWDNIIADIIVCEISKFETLLFSANKKCSFWWIEEQLVKVHPGENDSESGGKCFKRYIEQNSLKWKRCKAGYHQRTNDTVYIREFLEIIEPRGSVSRVKSSGPKMELWGTPQERVDNADIESLIETVWARDERWDEDQSSGRPSEPNHLWRRGRRMNDRQYRRLRISQEECKWLYHDPLQGRGHCEF